MGNSGGMIEGFTFEFIVAKVFVVDLRRMACITSESPSFDADIPDDDDDDGCCCDNCCMVCCSLDIGTNGFQVYEGLEICVVFILLVLY